MRSEYALLGLWLCLAGCSPRSQAQFKSGIEVPKEYEACAAQVDNFVRETRGWSADSYRVTVDESRRDIDDNDNLLTFFRIDSAPDTKATKQGDGAPFEVIMDCVNERPVRTLKLK